MVTVSLKFKVSDILARKGDEVACIDYMATALDAARQMNDRRIGSLVVLRGTTVIGIVTERDVLRKVVAGGLDPATTRVNSIMSSPVAVCEPDTDIEEISAIMTQKRIRHLPVVVDGRLQGIVTIGDVIASRMDQSEVTIQYLYEYLYSSSAPSG